MVPTNTPFSLALTSPYKFIQQIFSHSGHSSDGLATSVSTEFRRAFPDTDTRAKVPYLTRENVQTLKGRTVRWRGMVQDNSMGNEIVLATLPVPTSGSSSSEAPKCALYGADTLATDDQAAFDDTAVDSLNSASESNLTERSVLYAVGLPGRSGWAKDADRRSLALEEAGEAFGSPATSGNSQRASGESSSSGSTSSWGAKEKIPLPDERDALGVLLKVYDVSAAETLQAGDVVEVVGILDVGPLPVSEWDTGASPAGDSSGSQEEVHPTLHVLFHDKLADVWSAAPISEAARASVSASTTDAQAEDLRASLIRNLAAPLEGDEAAAEWLLLALIASIHTRKAPFALGHLSLRLRLPASSTSSSSALEDLLRTLLPSVAALPLTLKSLNDGNTSYAPHSLPDSTGLRGGRLQLPRGTTLLIHESIAEGQLGSHGLANLECLQEVISRNELGYKFPFNPAPFYLPVDLAVVILCQDETNGSEGGKGSEAIRSLGGGLIKCDVDVRINTNSGWHEHRVAGEEAQTSMHLLRNYLLTARRLARTLSVPASVADEIQRDFVASRNATPDSATIAPNGNANSSAVATTAAGISQEDLLRQMDIARLLSASRCKTELTFEDFKKAKRMDRTRLRELVSRRDFEGTVAKTKDGPNGPNLVAEPTSSSEELLPKDVRSTKTAEDADEIKHRNSVATSAPVQYSGDQGGSTPLSSSILLTVLPQWLWLLSLIFIGCCSNAYYLESSTSQIPNLGTLITFLQFFFTMLMALPSQLDWPQEAPLHSDSTTILGVAVRWKKNKVPLSRWGVQVLLYASTTLLNNTAFAYNVPMPVHIIFRSGGLVVNMFMGWLVRKKRYSLLQITSVILVTFGVILSTLSTSPSSAISESGLGGSQSPPLVSSYLIGISLLFLALFLSSLMGIWQEITFQKYGRDNWKEAIFYSHALSMPLLALRLGHLKEEIGLAMASEKAWMGINAAAKGASSRGSTWPPPGGIWDFGLLLPFLNTSYLPRAMGFFVPSILPLLALNVVTQLACINGVNRLTARVSSVAVTLVLVVRKAISLAISVLLVGGSRGGDMRTLSIGAFAVGAGTVGYAWASSGGDGGTGKKQGLARQGGEQSAGALPEKPTVSTDTSVPTRPVDMVDTSPSRADRNSQPRLFAGRVVPPSPPVPPPTSMSSTSSGPKLLTRTRLLYLYLGLALRLLLLFAGLLIDSRSPALPYTDVDYHVFTSGAHSLLHGCPMHAAVPPEQSDPFETLKDFTDPPGTTKDGCAKGWLAIGARYILQHQDVLAARSGGKSSAEEKRQELGQDASLSLIEPNRIETILLPVSLAILRPLLKPLAAMGNPYARPTYRYTPLLAGLLLPGAWTGRGSFGEKIWGKVVFLLADLAAGLLMWDIALRRHHKKKAKQSQIDQPAATPPSSSSFLASTFGSDGTVSRLLAHPTHSVGLLWLLNPFPAQIATRGSAEAVLCLALLAFVTSVTMLVDGQGVGDDDDAEMEYVEMLNHGNMLGDRIRQTASASMEGSDIDDAHSTSSTDDNSTIQPHTTSPSTPPAMTPPQARSRAHPSSAIASIPLPSLPLPLLISPLLLSLAAHLKLFPVFYGIPVLSALLFRTDEQGAKRGSRWLDATLFAVISAYAFLGLGAGLWMIWGQPFLDNSLLYHLTRIDHRHNFSPYFLPLYLLHTPSISTSGPSSLLLGMEGDEGATWTKLGSFAPQILVVVYIGYKIGRKGDILAACAAQSMAFVLMNKVGTSQYFLWYLPFLPPLLPSLRFRSTLQAYTLLAVWVGTQALWLSQAYLLEMEGQDVFVRVWAAGLAYVIGMGWVLVELIQGWERGRRVEERESAYEDDGDGQSESDGVRVRVTPPTPARMTDDRSSR